MNETLIYKFGGSCLKGSSDVESICSRIIESEGDRLLVVVSAFHGVTDRILTRLDNNDLETLDAFVASIELSYLEMVPSVVGSRFEDRFNEALTRLSESLAHHDGHLVSEDTDCPCRAESLACGERLSSIAIAAALEARGVDSTPIWADEAGIRITTLDGSSSIDLTSTKESFGLANEGVMVLTGWFGVEGDEVKLLSRGGSDLSATSLAAVLDASSVTIWRDVPGVLALAPKWSIPSRNLSYLSYTEAQELALFSEPMLHPMAVEPLRQRGIPLHLRPLHDPDSPGSCIGPSIGTGVPEVRAVGCLPRLVPLTFGLSGAVSVAKIVSAATTLLERSRVRVWSLMAKPTEARFLISERHASRAVRILSEHEFIPTPKRGEAIALLCLVGESIGVEPSVAERIDLLQEETGIVLTPLDEGRRNHALHFTVPAAETHRALTALAKDWDLLSA